MCDHINSTFELDRVPSHWSITLSVPLFFHAPVPHLLIPSKGGLGRSTAPTLDNALTPHPLVGFKVKAKVATFPLILAAASATRSRFCLNPKKWLVKKKMWYHAWRDCKISWHLVRKIGEPLFDTEKLVVWNRSVRSGSGGGDGCWDERSNEC